jgi:phosphoenolpyruvate carboxykinase (GTP)
MAMLPFCGYNMADYWSHWLSFGQKSNKLPRVFNVNWFRRGADGKFLWPGYGENLRVLRWVLDRCAGKGEAVRTPIGYLPAVGAIDTKGLPVTSESMAALTAVDGPAWRQEIKEIEAYFAKFGSRMPKALLDEAARVHKELDA